MNTATTRLAYLYVLLGAALWGTIGLFVNTLSGAGFSALQIVALRVVSATFMLFVYLSARNPALLKIEWRDSISFIGTGIFSIVFFNWCYFTAIEEVSLSVAVILLYTGPAFVTIMSRLFFKERVSARKFGALLLTVLGCMLVIRLVPVSDERISMFGLLVGLGSGFGYALYSIFGKHALKKYRSLTVTAYTFFFASLALVPVLSGIDPAQLASSEVWIIIAGLGFFPTVLAYLLYTTGLSLIESSRASITATVEPVVATLIGVTVYDERLSLYQVGGIFLILFAIVLIQLKKRRGAIS